MNNLNSVLLEGNLTSDPVFRITEKGTSVCDFNVASNRYYKKDGEYVDHVDFFDVVTWAGLADNCEQYLFKGRGVRVVGRLAQDRWIDTDGNNRYKVKVVAEHVEFKPHYSKNMKDED